MLKAALVARDVWSHRAMRCTILFVVLLLLAGGTGRGQHGTAESGYYPVTFNGQTFSGFVSTVNHDSREITLTYTNPESRKTERFVGVLAAGYTIRTPDRQEKVLDPAKLRIGGHFTFYYYEETRKVEGKKVKINTMFMIRGWPDTRPHYTVFKAFQ